jgi:hypothetical protein
LDLDSASHQHQAIRKRKFEPELECKALLVDHPFFCAIAEQESGALLFAGVVTTPRSTEHSQRSIAIVAAFSFSVVQQQAVFTPFQVSEISSPLRRHSFV